MTVFSQSVKADDILVVRKCVGSCSLPQPLTLVAEVTKENDVREHQRIFDPEFSGFNGRSFRVGIKEVWDTSAQVGYTFEFVYHDIGLSEYLCMSGKWLGQHTDAVPRDVIILYTTVDPVRDSSPHCFRPIL